MDACAECSIECAQLEIARTIDAARNVLIARGEADRVVSILEKPGAEAKTRSVYDTKNPPVSRRDLFRFIAVEGSKAAHRVLSSANDQPVGKVPPPERRRLLNVLKQFVPTESSDWQKTSATNLGLVRLEVDEKCTACGVCARACPTGAMQFSATDTNQYRLTLTLAHCTDCGVCIDLCEPTALHRDEVPTFAEFVTAEPNVLRAGGLKQCNRCNIKFADHIEGNLCSMCKYRIANPFGSRLPQVAKLRAE